MTTPGDYSVHIYKEHDGYIAVSPEWPGLSAFGDTAPGAYSKMQVVLRMAIEVTVEDGEFLPAPAQAEVSNPYSGKILLRLPRTLHGLVARGAKQDETSINTLLIQLISFALGATSREKIPTSR